MVNLESIFKGHGTGKKFTEEIVEILIPKGNIVRLERVVSPESDKRSKVYDQDEEEFVMVVKGYAELEFKDGRGKWDRLIMIGGDYITIPPHLRHRVIKTEEGTTWLALFYKK